MKWPEQKKDWKVRGANWYTGLKLIFNIPGTFYARKQKGQLFLS